MKPGRIRLVEFTNTLYLGGGEGQFVELLRGLPRHYQVSVLALKPVGPLLEAVRALGHEPMTFPLAGSMLQPNTLTQVGRLVSWLRRERVQVVHVHDFYPMLLAVPAARLAGAKVVVGRLDLCHGLSPARQTVLAAMTHAADRVIAKAEAVRQVLIHRERLPQSRICLIRNGLDLHRFDALQQAGPSLPLPAVNGPVAVLVANMLDPVKRQEDFLQALVLARRQHPTLEAFLVGEGPRRRPLEVLTERLGLSRVVHFLGFRTDVPALLAKGAVGVLCSRQEGLSNAVIEGMAASLPMVVTDAGGNRELVHHGERGLVVPVERPELLAEALSQVLSDSARARKMGQAGRSYVERELTLERMVAEHDALFRGLVSAG
jgi:glycosyltransferase involved in cell wall biosynthesis